MRIVFIIAGAGRAYCGSCLRDHAYARELLRQGDDVVLVPAYLPPQLERSAPQPAAHVVLGGISVYLLASFPWSRHLPAALLRALDNPRLLEWLAAYDRSTDPSQLAALATEMLKGPEGAAAREFEAAAELIVRHFRPDVVVLPNLMLTPLIPCLREAGAHRSIVSAAGEAAFIDALGRPARDTVWHWINRWAQHASAVVTYSRWYRDYVCERCPDLPEPALLPLPADLPPPASPQAASNPRTCRLLYLSRIAPEKGLDVLVEAAALAQERLTTMELALHVAGSLPARHQPFLDACRDRLVRALGKPSWHYHGEVARPQKWRLLRSADLWLLPTRTPDAQNLAAIEALGAGVPIVVPAHGWYPELAERTGGAVLVKAADVESLAEAIRVLASDAFLRAELGRRAADAVHATFSAPRASRSFRRLLEQLV